MNKSDTADETKLSQRKCQKMHHQKVDKGRWSQKFHPSRTNMRNNNSRTTPIFTNNLSLDD